MDLAAKLQLKPGQRIEGVGVPASVQSDLTGRMVDGDDCDDGEKLALLVFAADRDTLEAHRTPIVEAASRDRVTWVSYPKAGQRGTDLNRDSLAALLSESGIQPVRQIAIDGVWSALRFRPL